MDIKLDKVCILQMSNSKIPSNYFYNREKQTKYSGHKTDIFTQIQFSTKSIFIFDVTQKQIKNKKIFVDY